MYFPVPDLKMDRIHNLCKYIYFFLDFTQNMYNRGCVWLVAQNKIDMFNIRKLTYYEANLWNYICFIFSQS